MIIACTYSNLVACLAISDEAAAEEREVTAQERAFLDNCLYAFDPDRIAADTEDMPYLFYALHEKNSRVATFLVRIGASACRLHAGFTALYFAAFQHESDVLQTMLSRDPWKDTINTANTSNGNTALHEAAQSNDIEIAHILMQNDADVFAENDTGMTPRALASQWENKTVYMCKFLFQKERAA